MKVKLNIRDRRFLIIGGTTKAATTSLFKYLADHPDVCAASAKETRFFLDLDYPVKSKYRYEDGMDKYGEYFNHGDDSKLQLEATPDYLYSSDTSQKIKDSLPKAKLVFILREPFSRIVSWYKFAQQNGQISKDVTLEEYIEKQLHLNAGEKTEQHMRSLEQGRYSIYLNPYFDLFGRDRIQIIFYEELVKDPLTIVKSVSSFAEISPEFYEDYDFKVFNRTESMKNPKLHGIYKRFRFYVRSYTHNKPIIHKNLRRFRLLIEPLYFSLNKNFSDKIVIPPKIKIFIKDYYKEEIDKLEKLIGRSTPWHCDNVSSRMMDEERKT